jgi:hypothetical protein
VDFPQFIDQFKSLKQSYPIYPSHNLRCVNSDFGDYLASCKNAYYCFDDAECTNITYIYDSFKAVNCCDGDYVVESENCYNCVDTVQSYNSTHLNYCVRIYDSHFCYNCNDSNNLFGCVNLKYQKYCIFNKKYTESSYFENIRELLKSDPEDILNRMNKINSSFPVTVSHVNNSQNCDFGNQVFFSKNLYLCFDSSHSEDSAYLYDSHHNSNCYDLNQSFHCEFSYECTDCARLNRCYHMIDCEDMFDSGFCNRCSNSNHLLGCIALDKKQYCILNKQYSQKDYEENISRITASYLSYTKGSGKVPPSDTVLP